MAATRFQSRRSQRESLAETTRISMLEDDADYLEREDGNNKNKIESLRKQIEELKEVQDKSAGRTNQMLIALATSAVLMGLNLVVQTQGG